MSFFHKIGRWSFQSRTHAFIASLLLTAALLTFATWANRDAAEERAFLDMDEMIVFDGVKRILEPTPRGFFWAVFDGDDHRYGRIFYNVTALFSALPYFLAGDQTLIIAIRSTQVFFLIGAYWLLCRTMVLTPLGRLFSLVCLGALPFTPYYLTQPKPEPLQLLFIAAFIAFAIPRQFRFGWHWIFLGLAFGAKISVAPLIAAAGAVALIAAWSENQTWKPMFKDAFFATVMSIAGWCIAVPILVTPNAAHIDSYLHWTFRSTAHPWDNATTDFSTWIASLASGKEALNYFLPATTATTLLVGTALFILLVGVGEASLRPKIKTLISTRPEWVILGFAAALFLPIIFSVKRLWGFYLHPAEALGVVALVRIGESWWEKSDTQPRWAGLMRVASLALGAIFLFAIWQALPAIQRNFANKANRSKSDRHIDSAQTYREVNQLLAEWARKQPPQEPLRVYYDPFLYIPQESSAVKIFPFWQAFAFWDHRYEAVVLSHEFQIGYFLNEKEPPDPSSARFEGIRKAVELFKESVELDPTTPTTKPYRLVAWANARKAALIVRSDLPVRISANLPAGSQQP
jgi:hypothetical protein